VILWVFIFEREPIVARSRGMAKMAQLRPTLSSKISFIKASFRKRLSNLAFSRNTTYYVLYFILYLLLLYVAYVFSLNVIMEEYVGYVQGVTFHKRFVTPQEIHLVDLNSERQCHLFTKLDNQTIRYDSRLAHDAMSQIHGIPSNYGQNGVGNGLLKFCKNSKESLIAIYVKGPQQFETFRQLLPSEKIIVIDVDPITPGPVSHGNKCTFHKGRLDFFKCARERCFRLKRAIIRRRNDRSNDDGITSNDDGITSNDGGITSNDGGITSNSSFGYNDDVDDIDNNKKSDNGGCNDSCNSSKEDDDGKVCFFHAEHCIQPAGLCHQLWGNGVLRIDNLICNWKPTCIMCQKRLTPNDDYYFCTNLKCFKKNSCVLKKMTSNQQYVSSFNLTQKELNLKYFKN
jgi:hypothetical protein